MERTRQDLLVGGLLVAATAVVVGALIATSRIGERRYDLYMRAASAEAINVDTRVTLQGLEVGRVASVSPRVDSATRAVAFVVRLRIAERFPDGSSLAMPVGTVAEVVQPSPISPTVIQLHFPGQQASRLVLQEGDTIDSRRPRSVVDQLGQVAESLSIQVQQTLAISRAMMRRVQGAFGETEAMIRTTRPELEASLASLTRAIQRTDTLLASATNRVGPVQDSMLATLGTSRQLLARLDSTLAENRGDLRATVADMRTMSRQLNHFIDQLSRRPYRLLTGVRPLGQEDSTKAGSAQAGSRTPQP